MKLCGVMGGQALPGVAHALLVHGDSLIVAARDGAGTTCMLVQYTFKRTNGGDVESVARHVAVTVEKNAKRPNQADERVSLCVGTHAV